jgi:glyoxylase-like metal-dependent hydrolase (beta-lactamase superfamily II)
VTATTLAPGVFRIPTRGDGDNAFLVEAEDGLTLIDVGWKSAPSNITSALTDLRRRPSDIRRIIVTHAHPDHVRGLEEMVALTGAEVLIHEADAQWLARGQVPTGGRSGLLGKVIDRAPLLHWAPVQATRTLRDGELVAGLRVIHTPGHTPGHVVLHHLDSGALLVADAVFHRGGLTTGPNALAADPLVREESYRRIPAGASAIGFAHGPPLLRDEAATFTQWLAARSPS